METNCW